MPEPKYCVVVNPAAGGGRAGREIKGLVQGLSSAGMDFTCHSSERPGGCRQLASNARQAGCKHFICVGGDGTANEIVNGIFGVPSSSTPADPVTLAVVPWGTGNDWANYYQLPSCVDDFISLLRAGTTAEQDVGRVRFSGPEGELQHYFVNCIGTGFDSFLLGEMGSAKGSRLRYFRYLLKSFTKYKAGLLRVEASGTTLSYSALMLEVCLGKYIGAGMKLAPEAQADDGAFEVVLIETLNNWQLLKSLHYLYNGQIYKHPSVHHVHCNQLKISGQGQQRFQCDGELIGSLPVDIEIVRNALRIVTRA